MNMNMKKTLVLILLSTLLIFTSCSAPQTVVEEESKTASHVQTDKSHTPTSEENPFDYLAKMCPEYSQSVDLIKAFWNEYQDSSLRQLYNYCKHRGKPFYTELTKKGNPPKLMSIYLMVEGQKTEIPTATGEVMKKVSIQETIEALHSFDEGKLFPYIQKLIEEIVRVVQPSPIVL